MIDAQTVATDIARHGYCLVPNFLTGSSLDAAAEAVATYFPDPAVDNDADVSAIKHAVPFPFIDNALNHTVVDARILDVSEALLGTSDLRLTSSFVQAKYGTRYGVTKDQTLHNDAWSANSLLYPRVDGAYQRLFGIVYLNDVDVDTAPTYVVDRAQHLNMPLLTEDEKASYPLEDYPGLYAREVPIVAPKGSLLLFVGDLIHRGSAYTAEFGRRLALFFNIHSAIAGWTNKHLWSMRPASDGWAQFARFVVELTPRQRTLFGFPPPGDPYWCDDTLLQVNRMYPGIELAPYRPSASAARTPAST